ncbi:MAG: FadR family transcriptional regulator [Kiritimatiellae bacterium]|nr:FadR family transcriptional regulator [Kiritimatiellia bacterium]
MQAAIRTVSTAEAVVNHFRERIEAGALKPGDPLPSERILQRSLGISRFSLREGLARLSALGIITIRHGKGAFVTDAVDRDSLGGVLTPLFSSRDQETADELLDARAIIESQLATLAARRADGADLARIEEILDRSERALGDPAAFGRLDYEFHHQLAIVAKNRFLRTMIETLTDHMTSFLIEHARSAPARKAALNHHRQIYACVVERDSETIGPRMTAHIMHCWRRYKAARTS